MNIYQENKDGSLKLGSMTIPNAQSNRHYIQAMADVVSGEATIEAWEGSQREADYLAVQSDALSKQSALAAKLNGVSIDGVMCSATAEDQHGLSDIESFVLGGQSVNFHFENGSTMVLTPENWASFRLEWVAFRQSFFPLP